MILIASGAYVSPELQAELGRLPPCFLPVGNKRLFEYQIESLRKHFSDDIYVSVPFDFEISDFDQKLLAMHNVSVVKVPADLSLNQSLLYCINCIGKYTERLILLHGDTLLSDYPLGAEVISVSEVEDDYRWEIETSSHAEKLAWNGFFIFSKVGLFAQCLTIAAGNFVAAVRRYQQQQLSEVKVSSSWHDFGHVNTYFQARGKITTARSFNNLKVENGLVKKSSHQSAKIMAEFNWYKNIPRHIKKYVPVLVGENFGTPCGYEIEYLPAMPLNELYVHGNLPGLFWFKLLTKIDRYFASCAGGYSEMAACVSGLDNQESLQKNFVLLIQDKTQERIAAFCSEERIDSEAPVTINGQVAGSISSIIGDCVKQSLALQCWPGVFHGDLCFSNILYNSRADDIKVIDPRGIDPVGKPMIYGDLKYDIAKLLHSLIGGYDHILAGRYSMDFTNWTNMSLNIQFPAEVIAYQEKITSSWRPNGWSVQSIMPLVVLLFLSMLPLHSDNKPRQKALYANAFRLYSTIKEM